MGSIETGARRFLGIGKGAYQVIENAPAAAWEGYAKKRVKEFNRVGDRLSGFDSRFLHKSGYRAPAFVELASEYGVNARQTPAKGRGRDKGQAEQRVSA